MKKQKPANYDVRQTNNQPQFLIPNSLQLSQFPLLPPRNTSRDYGLFSFGSLTFFYTFAPSYKQLHNE